MDDLTISAMQQMQAELQEKYFDRWGGLSPAQGRSHLLWLLAEAGEAAQIIKKEGDRPILDCPETRAHYAASHKEVKRNLAGTGVLNHAGSDSFRDSLPIFKGMRICPT